MWLYRFLKERGRVTTRWDRFDELDWGGYTAWLAEQQSERGRLLSISHRRNLFRGLILTTKQAIFLDCEGISLTTLERLRGVAHDAFRDLHIQTQHRIEQRALTSEQYTDLYKIMAEEWQRYLDGKGKDKDHRRRANLPVLVACWLAFEVGIRFAELNALTIEDVQADPFYGKHRLLVHAPNKTPDAVPIEQDTLLLLQELIEAGTAARAELGCNLLFVTGAFRPHVLTTHALNESLRRMLRRHQYATLPCDLRLPDGRITLATHLAQSIGNRERVRRIMRHAWAATIDIYYRAQQKLVVAGHIAHALQAEAYRLTIACQRPIIHLQERPDQIEILERNPVNAELTWGSCGYDIERQGSCRVSKHCFDCPYLVPWVSKRHNYVYERDRYMVMAEQAEHSRDRENRLVHASRAEAFILLINRRIAQGDINDSKSSASIRQRRPRRTNHSTDLA